MVHYKLQKALKDSPLSSVTTNQWGELLLYLARICFFLGRISAALCFTVPSNSHRKHCSIVSKSYNTGKGWNRNSHPITKLAPGKATWVLWCHICISNTSLWNSWEVIICSFISKSNTLNLLVRSPGVLLLHRRKPHKATVCLYMTFLVVQTNGVLKISACSLKPCHSFVVQHIQL